MRHLSPSMTAMGLAALLSSCAYLPFESEVADSQTTVESGIESESNSEIRSTISEQESDSVSPIASEEPPHEPEPVASAPEDLLGDLASRFTWDTHATRPSVEREIRRHQERPEHFFEILQRSEPFLAIISEKIESRGMPAELALIPFVETGYDPSAFSRSDAAGLWQFIPSTARYMGLHTDWWYDERLDIELSTDKALEYLEYLSTRFDGNWELALAAYNGGEGHVASRIRRAGNVKDFWELTLKNETTAYVPKVLAIAEILTHPEKYEVEIPEIPLERQLVAVDIEHQIDLRLAAEEVDLSYQELKDINPAYLRWITPPARTNSLLVPADQAASLVASIDSIVTDEQLAWNHYRVQRGDTLIEIAREFGTTLRALVSVNQLKDSRIYINQDLLIPTSELPLTRLASQSNSVKQLYIVKRGDSLWDISRDQGVSISQIRRLNDLNNNLINVGQVLVLAETYTGEEITYMVKAGDSLSRIASRFQVAVAEIRAWNSLNGDLIRPGQTLRIRPNTNS